MSPRVAAALTLGGTILAAVVLWGTLGQQLDVPTVFGDELIHWDASRSLAAGDGLRVRESDYGFGPVYPLLLAPVHLLTADDLDAYRWARFLNAVLFALAALPVFLLARRLLPPGWSVACAALSVAIPSALYTGFVMTEGAAYVACMLALLAFARCLERPTVAAQVLALAALALAAGVRLQLASLGLAFAAALLLRGLLSRGLRLPSRDDLIAFWPLLVILGGGMVALAVRAALGNPLAGYGDLWRSYDLGDVGRWTWRAIAGLGLYLALVPLVVAPAVLAALIREGRQGVRPAAAFVPLFVCVNVVLLLVVGAFSSTEFGVGFLHDRYLFYVVPLWLVSTAVWAERRVPVRPAGLALGALLVIAPLATLPTYLLNDDGGRRFDAIAAGLPSQVAELAGLSEPRRWWLLVAGLLAVALVLLLARRRRWLVLVPVGLVFALDAGFAWDLRIEAARNVTFAPMSAATTAWVDRAVPEDEPVGVLAGSVSVETRDALRLTEFFNKSIGTAYDLAGGYAPTLASDAVRIAGGGVVVTDAGEVDADWIVAPRELELAGDVEAEGTVVGLRLWRVQGPLRVVEGRP
ncbi:MAG TPA: hypothetical protein VFO26_03070 [Gaiella sp.]|uniref:hypothetical protein n=1 Tax=Gaiella sp. TaxID=2663207 RepID=UPI002D7EF0BC|nr:hypothetical protein [Gaiella sp.]HET9286519.1 hypothetical protein [Gaiella sp.]